MLRFCSAAVTQWALGTHFVRGSWENIAVAPQTRMKGREDMSLERGSDLPPGSSTTPPAALPIPSPVHCPHCGSIRIRRPTRPLVLNIIACMAFLPLTLLLCAAVTGLLISLLALPVTTCIALVGRYRCLDCQHRFEPVPADPCAAASPRFPWRFHALNIVVLFLLCIAGPHLMAIKAGGGRLPDMMTNAGVFLIFGLFLWGSLLWHLALYHSLGRRVSHPLFWAILFVLPGVLGGTKVFHGSLPTVRVRTLLSFAELAPLPESAREIRIYTWSSPFSGEDLLRFTADRNDVERFLAQSPALQGQEPKRYSAQRMKLPLPKGFQSVPNEGNEYFVPRHRPTWYKQEIRGPARKYLVQPPRYQLPGEVLVDEETNTVYVYLCFS